MIRGRGRRYAIAAVVVAGLGACEPWGPSRARHLLLVTLDTTRADRIGCYGRAGAGTPTLDGLAASGARFARAYAHAPVTLPSHVSILTGLLPPRTGIHVNEQTDMDPAIRTLPQWLRERDFYTAAAVGGYPVSRRFPVSRGFEAFDDTMADPRNPAGLERDAGRVVDAAIDLAARRGDRRLFLWVHFFDPHDPYEPPDPFGREFAGDPYQGEIARVDAALDDLLRRVREGLGGEPLLVAVVGDHGEALGEHGEPTHGFFIYDSTMRVPLILQGPGVPEGRVVERPTPTVDLAPTLAVLLGVDPPEGLDGGALDLRAGRTAPSGPVYLETELPRRHYGWSALYGAVDGWRKVVSAPRVELYDLRRDPDESVNLAPDAPAEVAAMERWLERVHASGTSAGLAAARPDPRLMSLGYVGDVGSAGEDRWADPKDRLATYVAFQRASRLLEQGRPSEALPVLDRLLRDEDRPGTRFKRAQALRMAGRLDEAEAELLALDALQPPHPGVDLELTRIAIWEERAAEALERVDRHLARHPDDAEALMFRGAALEMLSDPGGAERSYRRALSINPLAHGPSLRLGSLLLATGRANEAAAWLRGHLLRHPGDEVARGLLGASIHSASVADAP